MAHIWQIARHTISIISCIYVDNFRQCEKLSNLNHSYQYKLNPKTLNLFFSNCSETTRPQPSTDQQAVISRLGRGQNAWQQLGIEPGSTQEEVNKAYRKLAILLHPDKTAVRGADEAFKLLGLARRTILNSFS